MSLLRLYVATTAARMSCENNIFIVLQHETNTLALHNISILIGNVLTAVELWVPCGFSNDISFLTNCRANSTNLNIKQSMTYNFVVDQILFFLSDHSASAF